MNAVLLTASLIFAVEQGSKLFASNVLERFCSADIACVCVDQEKGLDLGDPSDDSPDSDEFAEMCAFHDTGCDVLLGSQCP